MRVCITTITTSNYYQLYLPMFIYTLRKEYPEYAVKTFIKGKLSRATKSALKLMNLEYEKPITVFEKIKEKESTINCLRFLVPESHFKHFDYVIFVDIDLMLYRTDPDLLKWHQKRQRRMKTVYAGHHGPWRRKYRPEIAPRGWRGKFERVSGGFLMVTPHWFAATRRARKMYLKEAEAGRLGGFREFDEVMLGRIMKKSGLPMPPFGFSRDLRGIHLGDFKASMSHRYGSKKKMKKYASKKNIRKFFEYEKDPVWKGIVKIAEKNSKEIKCIMGKARHYLQKRLED